MGVDFKLNGRMNSLGKEQNGYLVHIKFPTKNLDFDSVVYKLTSYFDYIRILENLDLVISRIQCYYYMFMNNKNLENHT